MTPGGVVFTAPSGILRTTADGSITFYAAVGGGLVKRPGDTPMGNVAALGAITALAVMVCYG